MAESKIYSGRISSTKSARITAYIQRLAHAVFVESQKNVPVSSGYLKQSGKSFVNQNRIVIEYTAPYAKDVEEGRDGLSGGYVTPSDRGRAVFGRLQKREYRGGARPVPVGVKYNEGAPDVAWRTLDLSQPTEGHYFIEKAFKKIFGDGRRSNLGAGKLPKQMQK
tara:strand:+ start:910 stop:1404 length:495 start_codon:yes stop_codon:yes gene_type:complete